MSTNFFCRVVRPLVAIPSFIFALQVLAGVPEGARFYEDALRRYEKGDFDGAEIQLKNSIKENPRQLTAPLLLGKVLTAKGDLLGAEATYNQALAQGADRGELAIPMARIYIQMDRPAKAVELLTADPLPRSAQIEGLALRGSAYALLGRPLLAQKSFDDARAIDPNAVVIAIEEMPTLLRSGQIDRAREAASKAVVREPTNAAAWTMNAVVLRETGNTKASLAAYDQAVKLGSPQRIEARVGRAALLYDLGRYKDAQTDIEEAAQVAPNDLRVLAIQGDLARLRGDMVAANKFFANAADVFTQLPDSWFATREKFALMAAVVYQGLGDRQKALGRLDAMLALNPNNNAARLLQATIYLEMNDFERARAALESLRRTYGDDPNILYQQGVAFVGLGRYAEATVVLEAALPRMDTPKLRRTLALAQIGLGKDDLGIANLERVFNAAKDFEAGRALALNYAQRGVSKKALAVAEEMLKLQAGRAGALDFLGTIRGMTGDLKGARQAFSQALAKQPLYGPAAVNLAKLDANDGDFDAARRRLDKILSTQFVPDVLFELGLVELRAGQREQAIRHFRRLTEQGTGYRPAEVPLVDALLAVRRADEAIVAARGFIQNSPSDVALRLALARAQLESGVATDAREELKRATVLAEFDADKQVAIGRLQLYAANPDGALYNVQKALQGRPNDINALALAAAAALVKNDRDGADKALKELSSRYPSRVETLLAKAGAAIGRRQFSEAVALYNRALTVSETTNIALLLGKAHVSAGNPAAAARFYEGWLKKNPKDQEALKALAEAQFQSGQLKAAQSTYTAAVNADPENDALLNNLANVLLLLGDHAAAKKTAERALKVNPNSALYMDTLGWILVESGQPDVGLPYIREARLRNTANVEIRLHLAFALKRVGRQAEARSELTALLSANPGLASAPPVVRLKADLGL